MSLRFFVESRSGPPKPAPCQLSEDIPAISPISTCSVFIHDAMYTPKICRLSVNLHFKEFLSDFIISKIVSRYMMQSTRQKFCRLSKLDFEEFYPSHPRYPRYGTCSDPTCSDHARSMDIRPGVMFQTSRHLVTGLLIRKIVLVSSFISYFIIFHHIFTRSLGLSTPLLLAPVEGTGALGGLWPPFLEAVLQMCVSESVGHKFYIQLAVPVVGREYWVFF